ncbi:MAG: hypothetical protein Q7T49_02915 [bacterium]|nr:hypothetical protein [bacterium]
MSCPPRLHVKWDIVFDPDGIKQRETQHEVDMDLQHASSVPALWVNVFT